MVHRDGLVVAVDDTDGTLIARSMTATTPRAVRSRMARRRRGRPRDERWTGASLALNRAVIGGSGTNVGGMLGRQTRYAPRRQTTIIGSEPTLLPESTDVAPTPMVVTQLLAVSPTYWPTYPSMSPASAAATGPIRLGDALAVRLPRADTYVPDLLKEIRWLPHIAPQVVSPVPEVIAFGEACQAFPRPWAVLSYARRTAARSRRGAAGPVCRDSRCLPAEPSRGRYHRRPARRRALGIPVRRACHRHDRRLGRQGGDRPGRPLRPGRRPRGLAAPSPRPAGHAACLLGAHRPVHREHPRPPRRTSGGSDRLRRSWHRRPVRRPALRVEPARCPGSRHASYRLRGGRGHLVQGQSMGLRRPGPVRPSPTIAIPCPPESSVSPRWSTPSQPR